MSAVNARTALAYARLWHHVDASDQIVGRLATRLSVVLQGKHKPIFDRAADCGDYVVVTNASKLVFTGDKAKEKLYRRHTFWPGGLKTHTAEQLAEKDPCAILWKAVSGMLPKNRLRKERLSRLKIFADGQHPYGASLVKSYLPSPFNGFGKRL